MDISRVSFPRTVAFIPECRPDILSPAWFDWLKGIGYTGVYLENDPFQPPRSGNASQFGTLYRLISLYDLAWATNVNACGIGSAGPANSPMSGI